MASDSGLTVRFNLLGREETRFSSWSIDSAYLTSTDGFSFELVTQDPDDCWKLNLQPCELTVNGASQVLGRIDATDIGDDGTVVTCEGRDYLADLVECNVDPTVKAAPNTGLDELLLDAMGACAIDSVTDFENVLFSELRTGKKIKRAKRKRKKRPLQDLKPRPGEGIFEFCNRQVARHGATIQPSSDRTEVVIDAPDYTQTPLYDLVRSNDPETSGRNNIVRGRARRDYSKFPTYVLFTGNGGQSGKQTGTITKLYKMVELAEAFNSEMGRIMRNAIASDRPADVGPPGILYRLLYHRDLDARSEDDLIFAAKRAMAERLKDTLSYTCTVRGHTDPRTGAVYSVNTMANVDDNVANIHEPLWIARRTLRYTDGEGAMTDLELWRPESFQITDDENGS